MTVDAEDFAADIVDVVPRVLPAAVSDEEGSPMRYHPPEYVNATSWYSPGGAGAGARIHATTQRSSAATSARRAAILAPVYPPSALPEEDPACVAAEAAESVM